MSELITKVFVEKPLALPGSAKKRGRYFFNFNNTLFGQKSLALLVQVADGGDNIYID